MHQPYSYIRKAYGVDPEVGQWVKHTVTARYGVVSMPDDEGKYGGGHYVQIRFCGDDFSLPCHPKELLYGHMPPALIPMTTETIVSTKTDVA